MFTSGEWSARRNRGYPRNDHLGRHFVRKSSYQALAIGTAGVVRKGHLTVDRERARSLARAREAIDALKKANKAIPPETITSMEKFINRHYFWVPDMRSDGGGQIVEYRGRLGPYDRGTKGNWEYVMGKGWKWILPWVALQRGVGVESCFNWPLAPEAEGELRGPVNGVEDLSS